jgi:hypothetical protein
VRGKKTDAGGDAEDSSLAEQRDCSPIANGKKTDGDDDAEDSSLEERRDCSPIAKEAAKWLQAEGFSELKFSAEQLLQMIAEDPHASFVVNRKRIHSRGYIKARSAWTSKGLEDKEAKEKGSEFASLSSRPLLVHALRALM